MINLRYIILVCTVLFLGNNHNCLAQDFFDVNREEAEFLASEVIFDKGYHKGAILVMDLNKDPRKLKSTFCSSCHDGSVASTGHTSTNYGNSENVNPNTFFSFNHPVAFEYSSGFAASRYYLKDPKTTPSGLGGTIAEDLLVDDRVECVTCHNIFFDTRDQEKSKVWNVGSYFSELCVTCHNI